MRNAPTLLLLLALLMSGASCRAEAPPPPGSEESSENAPPNHATAPSKTPTTAGDSALAWGTSVAWQSWEHGSALARAQRKPMLVVVYADWCARCKELAPVFERPEVAALAQQLVVVRQNHDERPAWLTERLGRYGQYVPRIFFLDPDGNMLEQMQSGHPRYPYFYGPLVTDRLTDNMRSVLRI